MTNDLVQRLRGIAGFETATNEMNVRQHTCWKAADIIEKLTAERDILVDALRNLRDTKGRYHTEQAFVKAMKVLAAVEKTK